MELAMQLEKLWRQNRLVQRLVRKTQDGTVGQGGDVDDEEDDTVFQVGDNVTHNHVTQPKANGLSNLARMGLLATALASSAGLGALAYQILNPPSQITDTDTDTSHVIEFIE